MGDTGSVSSSRVRSTWSWGTDSVVGEDATDAAHQGKRKSGGNKSRPKKLQKISRMIANVDG